MRKETGLPGVFCVCDTLSGSFPQAFWQNQSKWSMGPPGGGPEPATQRTTSYFWEKSPGQAQQGNLDVSQALEFAVTLAVIFSPCRVTQMPHCFFFSSKRAWTNVNKPCQVNFSFQHMNISISGEKWVCQSVQTAGPNYCRLKQHDKHSHRRPGTDLWARFCNTTRLRPKKMEKKTYTSQILISNSLICLVYNKCLQWRPRSVWEIRELEGVWKRLFWSSFTTDMFSFWDNRNEFQLKWTSWDLTVPKWLQRRYEKEI